MRGTKLWFWLVPARTAHLGGSRPGRLRRVRSAMSGQFGVQECGARGCALQPPHRDAYACLGSRQGMLKNGRNKGKRTEVLFCLRCASLCTSPQVPDFRRRLSLTPGPTCLCAFPPLRPVFVCFTAAVNAAKFAVSFCGMPVPRAHVAGRCAADGHMRPPAARRCRPEWILW